MLEQHSIIAWLNKNRFINEMGDPITFHRHFFLYDIYRDWAKEQAVMKCSQIGESTERIIKSTFGAKCKRFNIIYTLPTDDDVSKFVRTKVDKMIQLNPQVYGNLKGNVDNVKLKEIGDRFLMFQGTVSKSAAIMATGDLLVHDEIDRSDLKVIADFRSRVKASRYKGIHKLSNPSLPEIGIHKEYLESDMKRWHVKCGECKKLQPLDFEANVNPATRQFVCRFCGLPITDRDRARGVWIPEHPDRKKSGYHISHLMAPWISAGEIIDDVLGTTTRPPDPEYAYNFVLGLPYEASDVVVGAHVIMDNWTPRVPPGKQMYLGVDVGRQKHFVLGVRGGIMAVGTFEDWSYLDEIITKFDPITVIDALPETTMSDTFIRRYTGRVFKCYYARDRDRRDMLSWGSDKEEGTVKADRSRVMGELVRELNEGKILVSIPKGDKLTTLVRHFKWIRRMKEEDHMGNLRYQWTTVNPEDHYVHAAMYWLMARTKGNEDHRPMGGGAVIVPSDEPPSIVAETESGVIESRLREAMLESGFIDTGNG